MKTVLDMFFLWLVGWVAKIAHNNHSGQEVQALRQEVQLSISIAAKQARNKLWKENSCHCEVKNSGSAVFLYPGPAA